MILEHYDHLIAEVASLAVGMEKMQAEVAALAYERDQLKRELDEARDALRRALRRGA